MATRRKYKDGGRVLADIVIPDGQEQSSAEPPATASSSAPQVEDNPLQRALEAQNRAEELQRQAVQRQPTEHDRFVDSLPGLTDRKRAFLKANPALTDRDISALAGRHYKAGLAAGIADDTEDIERYILDNVAQEVENRRQLTAAYARPTPENDILHHQISSNADDLQREAESILAEMALEQPVQPPPAPRRSMPLTAPVSRDVPMLSGERRSSQISLRPDEADIAHRSFPHLTKFQAEWEYAQNKRKMLAMKADGRIQGDG